MGKDRCVDIQPPEQDQSAGDSNKTQFKTSLPQIAAAITSASFHIVCGIALAYSAILIPQLQRAQSLVNSTNDVIYVSETDNSWIASSVPLVIPIAALLGGPVMDSIGRLNVVRLAAIPSTIGWILIATATGVPMILCGRVLTGLAVAWGMSPCLVYISEISSPQLRGSLTALGPAFASLGMLCAYLEGWLFHWRLVAWISLIFTIIPVIMMTLIPRSPQWLISKGRNEKAKQSLHWFNRYDPQAVSKTEAQFKQLVQEQQIRQALNNPQETNVIVSQLKVFSQPTVYKPLLVLLGLCAFQQLSGVFIFLFYAVTLFDAVGTNLDPFLVSVYIGAVRFGMAVAAVWLMRRFRRRHLIIVSGLGMSVCMTISGLYTKWIQDGTSTQTWIPVAMFLLYITSSMIGFLIIPVTIISELYPIKGRGLTQSTSVSVLYILMFASTRCYYVLNEILGGSSGLQYLFAAASLAGVAYSYVFLPETHKKTLSDIEKYFELYNTYPSYKNAQRKQDKNLDMASYGTQTRQDNQK